MSARGGGQLVLVGVLWQQLFPEGCATIRVLLAVPGCRQILHLKRAGWPFLLRAGTQAVRITLSPLLQSPTSL